MKYKIELALIFFFSLFGNSYILAQTVTDIDGNIYKTVNIGNQVWMTENLRVEHFRNGDSVKVAETDEDWNMLGGGKEPLRCDFKNSIANAKKYGKLYNLYAVNDGRGLAPVGWHIPTPAEWDTLIFYLLGNDKSLLNSWKYDQKSNSWPAIPGIGGMLKEVGTKYWNKPNIGATNSSGFTALPGGTRDGMGPFRSDPGTVAVWWAYGHEIILWKYKDKIEVSKNSYVYVEKFNELHGCIAYYILQGDDELTKREVSGWNGYSVRCIKD